MSGRELFRWQALDDRSFCGSSHKVGRISLKVKADVFPSMVGANAIAVTTEADLAVLGNPTPPELVGQVVIHTLDGEQLQLSIR